MFMMSNMLQKWFFFKCINVSMYLLHTIDKTHQVRIWIDLRSLHTESEIFACVFLFFSYSSSFPIKMLATDPKPQKIEPDPNFFLWRMNVSEAVCKHDWHNVRSYLLFKVQKFQTTISDSVCKDLYCHWSACKYELKNFYNIFFYNYNNILQWLNVYTQIKCFYFP